MGLDEGHQVLGQCSNIGGQLGADRIHVNRRFRHYFNDRGALIIQHHGLTRQGAESNPCTSELFDSKPARGLVQMSQVTRLR